MENPSELSENAMQAAGRLSSHTYADLRSARRAFQRTRKYPQKRSRNQDYCRCCFDIHYNETRLAHKKEIQNALRRQVWEDDLLAEKHINEDHDQIGDVEYFEKFGRWREGVVNAEDFGAWGRRRINEMRKVKEDRIRRAARNDGIDTVMPSSPFPAPTTLPTTSSDIHHHALLTEVLKPSKWLLGYLRREKRAPFPIIEGFYWFGEFKWAWHRNASGCWEFGGECDGCALPCPCCCTGNGSMYYPCSCAEFRGTVAPEDVQTCSLVEWVKGRLRGVMVKEEQMRAWKDSRDQDDSDCGADMTDLQEMMRLREEWDVVSNASEEWSMLSEESEFDMI
jgi:hypothetical protein